MTQALARDLLTTDAGLGHWTLDAQASTVHIAHKTMWGLVNVKGTFGRITGEGQIEAGGSLTGNLVIDAASIDTKNKKRDIHLRSADFFDVENHPQIVVEVISAKAVVDGVQLQAELSVKGIREPLTLTGQVDQVTPNAVTVAVQTKVDRERFGLSWNQMGMMKGAATVTVNAVFTRS